jgi:hypothetical protein
MRQQVGVALEVRAADLAVFVVVLRHEWLPDFAATPLRHPN